MPGGSAFGVPVLYLTPVLAGELGGGPFDPEDPVQIRPVGARGLFGDVNRASAERAEPAACLGPAASYPLVHLFIVVDDGHRVFGYCRYGIGPEVPLDHHTPYPLKLLHGRVHGQVRGW